MSVDLDEVQSKLSPKSKLLIMNSPQNPTGGVLTDEDIDGLARILQDYPDVWVLADEIYSKTLYEGRHSSISTREGMLDRTIILDGFSKTYAMTGWRLGYGVMPPKLADHVARFATNCNSCTATFVQKAGISLGLLVTGYGLKWIGYVQGAQQQSPSAVRNLLLVGFVGGTIVGLAAVILPIVGALKAHEGLYYRYPVVGLALD